jgi:hypothetical protein
LEMEATATDSKLTELPTEVITTIIDVINSHGIAEVKIERDGSVSVVELRRKLQIKKSVK